MNLSINELRQAGSTTLSIGSSISLQCWSDWLAVGALLYGYHSTTPAFGVCVLHTLASPVDKLGLMQSESLGRRLMLPFPIRRV
jgi:hypothetical protein